MSDNVGPQVRPLFGVTPGHNLGMDLVRVTEAGALAAARWLGRGDKDGADGAAVDAMRTMLTTISMDGLVVIGEGEKDEAPMLYNGERVGNGEAPLVDVAVDPVDGTTLTAKGQPSALVLLAVADRVINRNDADGLAEFLEELVSSNAVAPLGAAPGS